MTFPSRNIIVAVAATALLLACGGDAPAPAAEAEAIPVRVVTPVMRRSEPQIVLTGTLGAKEEIPLGFKVGGVVEQVTAEVGQRVRAGDLLAALSLTEIDAQVAAAREGRDKARRDLQRVQALFADSVATQAQLDDARTGLELAEAQLRAAAFNREYAEVRAPVDGTVLRRQVERGQLVGSGTPVFVLRATRTGLVLRAGAADRDAVRLRDGMNALVEFDAFPGDGFNGRVQLVGVAASPMTGTYEVEIAVDGGTRALVSGLIGRARITPARAQAVPTVPAEALLEVDGRWATIFVLDPESQRAVRRRVNVLWLDGPVAALSGGLDSTTQVITAGATRLRDGTSVQVVAERAP